MWNATFGLCGGMPSPAPADDASMSNSDRKRRRRSAWASLNDVSGSQQENQPTSQQENQQEWVNDVSGSQQENQPTDTSMLKLEVDVDSAMEAILAEVFEGDSVLCGIPPAHHPRSSEKSLESSEPKSSEKSLELAVVLFDASEETRKLEIPRNLMLVIDDRDAVMSSNDNSVKSPRTPTQCAAAARAPIKSGPSAPYRRRARNLGACGRPESGCGRQEFGFASLSPAFDPSVYHTGYLLREATRRYWEIGMMDDTIKRNVTNFPCAFDHAGACTGTGMDSIVIQNVCAVLGEHGKQVEPTCRFDCEIDERKRLFIDVTKPPGCDACSFPKIEDLQRGECPCYRHGVRPAKGRRSKEDPGMCSVDHVFLWTACTSCTYFSRLSGTQDGPKISLLSAPGASSTHQSKTTYEGHIAYIRKYEPVIVLYESTNAVNDETQSCDDKTIDVILADLHDAGYAARAFKMNSKDYYVPQSRVRILVGGVLLSSEYHSLSSMEEGMAAFDKVAALLLDMQGRPVDYRTLLLPNNHPLVEQELLRRQNMDLRLNGNGRAGWPSLHQRVFREADMRWGDKRDMTPHPTTASSRWLPTLPLRDRECLTYASKTWGMCTNVDTSQNINRLRRDSPCELHKVRVAPTVLPGQTFFMHSCEADPSAVGINESRLMIGHEMLTLQAYPWQSKESEFQKFRESLSKGFPSASEEVQIADLAGNAVCGTVLSALCSSIIMAVPWLDQDDLALASATELVKSTLFAAMDL